MGCIGTIYKFVPPVNMVEVLETESFSKARPPKAPSKLNGKRETFL